MGNPEPETKVCRDAGSSSVNQRSPPDYSVNFVKLVKNTFEHQPETYREFLHLLSECMNYRISLDCLIVKVHLLFKEHKELLKGFNQFVPWQYKGSNDFNFEDAIEFVRDIKDLNISESFLQVLYKYRTGTYDLDETLIEVSKLFKDHPDLLMEYPKYLPTFISEQSQPTAIRATAESAAVYVKKVKERFQDQPGKYGVFLTIMKDFKNSRIDEYKTIAKVWDFLKGNHDLVMGFNEFLPEHCRMKMLLEYDHATDIINTIQGRLKYDLSLVSPFIEIIHRYILDKITFDDFYTEVMEVLKNHPALLDELRIPILMVYLSMSPARRHLSRKDLFEVGWYVTGL